MGDVKKVRTACRQCHGGCGVIAHVQDGKVIKVEGDPQSPISNGTLCSKGLSVTQLAYHPDRILHPMRKTAQGWERITWDEALDTIAEKFNAFIKAHGPESIVIGQGTGRDYESHLYRFANQLGTPNVLTAGHMCYVSRVASTLVTVTSSPGSTRPASDIAAHRSPSIKTIPLGSRAVFTSAVFPTSSSLPADIWRRWARIPQ